MCYVSLNGLTDHGLIILIIARDLGVGKDGGGVSSAHAGPGHAAAQAP